MIVQFEKNTPQYLKEAALMEYFKDHLADVENAHNSSLWDAARGFAETLRPQLLRQMKAKIVNPKKADSTVV